MLLIFFRAFLLFWRRRYRLSGRRTLRRTLRIDSFFFTSCWWIWLLHRWCGRRYIPSLLILWRHFWPRFLRLPRPLLRHSLLLLQLLTLLTRLFSLLLRSRRLFLVRPGWF